MSQPVRAVIFDWGGTLTPWHDVDLVEQWHVFARAASDRPNAMSGATGRSSQQQVSELASRILALEDAAWAKGRAEGVSARLHELLTAAGLDPEHASSVGGIEAYRAFWEEHTYTDPLVKPTWEALRDNGIRVAVLSNTIWDRTYHRSIFERDGVAHLIDVDVYSSETPWVKPWPEIFRLTAERLGVEPTECVYVGDRSYEDVHGPQQVGMRAIWVPHSSIPEAQQASHEATPDAVAHRLSDVVDIVARWNAATLSRP